MRRRLGFISAIVVLVVLARLGVVTAVYDWLWQFAEETTPWVQSPDGQWSAQVRARGIVPDVRRHLLFLRYRNGRAKGVCYVSQSWGGLRWSPDSRRIAGASVYKSRGGYHKPWTVWVYDTVSKHRAIGFGEDSSRRNTAQELMDEERERKLWENPDFATEFRWKWRGSKEILGYIAKDSGTGEFKGVHPLFVFTIDDTPSQMLITWRRLE